MLKLSLFNLILTTSLSFSQIPPALPTSPTPSTPPTPATPATSPPPSPVSGIRNKISAGDLLSAESILEVHKQKNGEDGPWLLGLSWLARGALLLGDTTKARLYAAETRMEIAERMSRGTALEKDHDMEIAYGAAVETEAQRIERSQGVTRAAEYLRGELAQVKSPVALVSRITKRLNMLTLTGQQAPELETEDFLYNKPSTFASLRGKPVLLFIWAEGCGDCKAQSASLAKVTSLFKDRGLQVVTLTRYYDDDSLRSKEKARMDSVWKSVYPDMGTNLPMVISTASMERYGGSSTPTFVFIDKAGIVRRYTPTRLTEKELERALNTLVK